MIVLDSSVLVAIALGEPEEEIYSRIITVEGARIGAPSMLEVNMVLSGMLGERTGAFFSAVEQRWSLDIVPFDQAMYAAAASAFERFGKGRGHPAQLNFGDCMAYAVAKVHDLPLLFKGDDFSRTDIKPAF